MSSRRVLKAAEAIREVVGMAILADLRDPRIKHVTVTRVEVSGDMREAKIHVSVMGEPKQQQLCLYGLESAAGFLQSKVAARIDTRYTPKLKFFLDQGVKNSLEIARILNQVLPKTAAEPAIEGEADDMEDDGDLSEDGEDSPAEASAISEERDDAP